MNISSLLQGIASFAWIGLFGVIVAIFIRASRNQPTKGLNTVVIVLLVAAIVLTSAGAAVIFIEPDELGVVVTAVGGSGIRPEPLPSGLHWVIPFVEPDLHDVIRGGGGTVCQR